MNQHTAADATIRELFPVHVLDTTLANPGPLNDALKAAILKEQAADAGVNRSNIGGWHSNSEMLRWGGEAAKILALETIKTCGGHTTDVGMRSNQPRYEFGLEMWANISPAGASNQMHSHPGALWSAVYYVDDGGDPEAHLVLQDPNYPTNRMYAPDLQFVTGPKQTAQVRETFAPTPGRLVIFPSWLNHAVRPHNGERPRISIAMNVLAIPARPAPPSGAPQQP